MEIISALIGALIAALVTYFISNRDLSDSLDSKSGWREKLFTVASKYELTLDDAQTVRAALRIFPNDKEVQQYSFTWFSNIMIIHLDKYILNRDYKQNVISDVGKTVLNSQTTNIVRLFAMFLLKYHFDYRGSMGAKGYLHRLGRDTNRIYNTIVKETYIEYMKLMG